MKFTKSLILMVLTVSTLFVLASCGECKHEDTNWHTVNEPTCASEGARQRVCKDCGDILKTENLEKTEHTFNKTVGGEEVCTVCGYVINQSTGISFKTLAVSGTNAYGKVANDIETFSFTNEIVAVGGAKYTVSTKITGENPITSKTIELESGDNTVYVTEMIDGEPTTVYKVVIRRIPVYEVTFYTAGAIAVESQFVEEGSFATMPEAPVKIGYDFAGWNYDFNTPITEDITITAKYIVKPEMAAFNFISSEKNCEITGIKDRTATKIVIPDYVTIIGYGAFCECAGLTSVVIPDSISYIDGYTFSGCTNLTSIILPDSVTSIGPCSFSDCSSLVNIEIPDSVTRIDNYAFAGCNSLTSVEIPDSVTSIGSSTFYNCSSLTSVTIGNSVTSIGDSVFEGCTSIMSVALGNGITKIQNDLFSGLASLTTLTIGKGVISVASSAFEECGSLKDVYYMGSIAEWCNISFSNYGSNPMTAGANLYIDGNLVRELMIPDTATEIKKYVFAGCSSLVSLVIPDSVTSIGPRSFSDCSSLVSIEIPDSVTRIDNHAFAGCNSLTSVEIPDSVTSIGKSAFTGCSSLVSVTMGNGVTSIGDVAFRDCSSLVSVTIGNGVTSIGYEAFRDCSSLTSIKYRGTEAQWNAISKGSSWSYRTGNYTITYESGNVGNWQPIP